MTGSPVPKLYKFVGKDWKHNYGLEGQIGENLNTIKDTLNLVLNYFLPSERAAVEALFNAEKLIVFVQTKGDDGERSDLSVRENCAELLDGAKDCYLIYGALFIKELPLGYLP